MNVGPIEEKEVALTVYPSLIAARPSLKRLAKWLNSLVGVSSGYPRPSNSRSSVAAQINNFLLNRNTPRHAEFNSHYSTRSTTVLSRLGDRSYPRFSDLK